MSHSGKKLWYERSGKDFQFDDEHEGRVILTMLDHSLSVADKMMMALLPTSNMLAFCCSRAQLK